MRQMINDTISDKRSLPYNIAGTGTIVTFGVAIVGTGTLFTSEMKAGSYLVSESQNECRRVVRVDSDTVAFLEIAFTSNLSSAAPSIIPWYASKPKLISIASSGPITVNGNVFDGIMEVGKTGNNRSSRKDLIEPIIVDATVNATQIEILY